MFGSTGDKPVERTSSTVVQSFGSDEISKSDSLPSTAVQSFGSGEISKSDSSPSTAVQSFGSGEISKSDSPPSAAEQSFGPNVSCDYSSNRSYSRRSVRSGAPAAAPSLGSRSSVHPWVGRPSPVPEDPSRAAARAAAFQAAQSLDNLSQPGLSVSIASPSFGGDGAPGPHAILQVIATENLPPQPHVDRSSAALTIAASRKAEVAEREGVAAAVAVAEVSEFVERQASLQGSYSLASSFRPVRGRQKGFDVQPWDLEPSKPRVNVRVGDPGSPSLTMPTATLGGIADPDATIKEESAKMEAARASAVTAREDAELALGVFRSDAMSVSEAARVSAVAAREDAELALAVFRSDAMSVSEAAQAKSAALGADAAVEESRSAAELRARSDTFQEDADLALALSLGENGFTSDGDLDGDRQAASLLSLTAGPVCEVSPLYFEYAASYPEGARVAYMSGAIVRGCKEADPEFTPLIEMLQRCVSPKLRAIDRGGGGRCGDNSIAFQLRVILGGSASELSGATVRAEALGHLRDAGVRHRKFRHPSGTLHSIGEWASLERPDGGSFDTWADLQFKQDRDGVMPYLGHAALAGVADFYGVIVEVWAVSQYCTPLRGVHGPVCYRTSVSPVPTIINPSEDVKVVGVVRLANVCDTHFVAIVVEEEEQVGALEDLSDSASGGSSMEGVPVFTSSDEEAVDYMSEAKWAELLLFVNDPLHLGMDGKGVCAFVGSAVARYLDPVLDTGKLYASESLTLVSLINQVSSEWLGLYPGVPPPFTIVQVFQQALWHATNKLHAIHSDVSGGGEVMDAHLDAVCRALGRFVEQQLLVLLTTDQRERLHQCLRRHRRWWETSTALVGECAVQRTAYSEALRGGNVPAICQASTMQTIDKNLVRPFLTVPESTSHCGAAISASCGCRSVPAPHEATEGGEDTRQESELLSLAPKSTHPLWSAPLSPPLQLPVVAVVPFSAAGVPCEEAQLRLAFVLAVGMVDGEPCGLLVQQWPKAGGCMVTGGYIKQGEEPLEASLREFAEEVGFGSSAERAREELLLDDPVSQAGCAEYRWRAHLGVTFVILTPRLLDVARLAQANSEANGALLVKLTEFSAASAGDAQYVRPWLRCLEGEVTVFEGAALSLRNPIGDAVATLAEQLLGALDSGVPSLVGAHDPQLQCGGLGEELGNHTDSAVVKLPQHQPISPRHGPYTHTPQHRTTKIQSGRVLAGCEHGKWVDVAEALHPYCCGVQDSLRICTLVACVTTASSWWKHYTTVSPLLGSWALCERHGRAVCLHGQLDQHVVSRHGQCMAEECWDEAAQLGSIPPPGQGTLFHAPSLTTTSVISLLARLGTGVDEDQAVVAASVQKCLQFSREPLALVIGGGRNDRADSYSAFLWRGGFVVLNLDICNDSRHRVGSRPVNIATERLARSGLLVVFSNQQPCGPFTVLRLKRIEGQPAKWPTLVDSSNPDGIPEMWNHPVYGAQLQDTWDIIKHVVLLIPILVEKGGNFWVENPPNWGWFRDDAASHSSLFDTTLMVTVAKLVSAVLFIHDQCGWGALAIKRTGILIDPRWSRVYSGFDGYHCSHSGGTHLSVGVSASDQAGSKKHAAYPRGYGRGLADAAIQVASQWASRFESISRSLAVSSLQVFFCEGCGDPGDLLTCITRSELESESRSVRFFCNNRPGTSATSCIIRFLQSHAAHWHCSVQAPKSSPLHLLPLRCSYTGSENVFELGAVLLSTGKCAVVAQPALKGLLPKELDGGKWSPVVYRGALAHWLIGKPSGPCSALTAANAQGPSATSNFLEPVQSLYGDADCYVRVFSALLSQIAREEEANARIPFTEGVAIEWSLVPDLSMRGVVSTRHFSGRVPQVGDELDLISAVTQWTAICVVEATEENQSSEVDASPILTILLTSVQSQPPVDELFTVSPLWRSTNLERQQTALRMFQSMPFCMSPAIREVILGSAIPGTPPPPTPLRVHVPADWCAPNTKPPNESQATAIADAIRGDVTCIQGPPGTGKTDTAVHIVYLWTAQRRGPVLVCAPSNAAVDNLACRIAATGVRPLRFLTPRRVVTRAGEEPIDPAISMVASLTDALKANGMEASRWEKLCKLKQSVGGLDRSDAQEWSTLYRTAARFALEIADVVCCTCSTAGSPLILEHSFPFCLIDEAAQATEPEVLVPLCRGVSQAVLVADHHQLGPVVTCQAAQRAGLPLSLFQRLIERGHPYRMLQIQYRMHPSISSFPSAQFYGGSLLDGVSAADRASDVRFPWPTVGVPVLFLAIIGREDNGRSGVSFVNSLEAEALVEATDRLLIGGALPQQIGVATLYAGQVLLIRRVLLTRFSPATASSITVATAEAFQGQERDFMLVSFVRTGERLGFARDPRRINVAITRARCGLIMVGYPPALRRDPLYEQMLLDLRARGLIFHGNLGSLQPYPFYSDSEQAQEQLAARLSSFLASASYDQLRIDTSSLNQVGVSLPPSPPPALLLSASYPWSMTDTYLFNRTDSGSSALVRACQHLWGASAAACHCFFRCCFAGAHAVEEVDDELMWLMSPPPSPPTSPPTSSKPTSHGSIRGQRRQGGQQTRGRGRVMVFDHTPEPTPATEALAASSLDEVRGRQVHVSNTFLELGKHAEQFLIRVPDAAILIGCCTSSAHAAAAALAAGVAVICLDSVERDGSDALKWTTRAPPSSPPVHLAMGSAYSSTLVSSREEVQENAFQKGLRTVAILETPIDPASARASLTARTDQFGLGRREPLMLVMEVITSAEELRKQLDLHTETDSEGCLFWRVDCLDVSSFGVNCDRKYMVVQVDVLAVPLKLESIGSPLSVGWLLGTKSKGAVAPGNWSKKEVAMEFGFDAGTFSSFPRAFAAVPAQVSEYLCLLMLQHLLSLLPLQNPSSTVRGYVPPSERSVSAFRYSEVRGTPHARGGHSRQEPHPSLEAEPDWDPPSRMDAFVSLLDADGEAEASSHAAIVNNEEYFMARALLFGDSDVAERKELPASTRPLRMFTGLLTSVWVLLRYRGQAVVLPLGGAVASFLAVTVSGKLKLEDRTRAGGSAQWDRVADLLTIEVARWFGGRSVENGIRQLVHQAVIRRKPFRGELRQLPVLARGGGYANTGTTIVCRCYVFFAVIPGAWSLQEVSSASAAPPMSQGSSPQRSLQLLLPYWCDATPESPSYWTRTPRSGLSAQFPVPAGSVLPRRDIVTFEAEGNGSASTEFSEMLGRPFLCSAASLMALITASDLDRGAVEIAHSALQLCFGETMPTDTSALAAVASSDFSGHQWLACKVASSTAARLLRGEPVVIAHITTTVSSRVNPGDLLALSPRDGLITLWAYVVAVRHASCYSVALQREGGALGPLCSFGPLGDEIAFMMEHSQVSPERHVAQLESRAFPIHQRVTCWQVALLHAGSSFPSLASSIERVSAVPSLAAPAASIIDFRRASQLPWVWGSIGSGVGAAILRREKTVEVRFRSVRLFLINNVGPLLRELIPGDLFVYREGPLALVLRVITAPYHRHDTRGHAVEVHKQAAVPMSLVDGFYSEHPPYSPEWGNQFYNEHFGVASRSGREGAVAVQFELVGQAQTNPDHGDGLLIRPIAYAPKTLRVPAWSEAILWVNVPAAGVVGKDIVILPLEDSRVDDLRVLVAPAIVRPDAEGRVPIRVINLDPTQPVIIPLLTPVARFMVNPEISGVDTSLSVNAIMERCNIPENATEEDRTFIRRMILSRRKLFSDTLGVAHGYRASIKTPLVDSGQVPAPAFPYRKRSPAEYVALRDEVDKQLKAGLLTKVQSPYNAMPLLVAKPDGSKRLVLDYRALNAVCVKDTYPLPNIEENLSLLGKANLYTTADLLQGFHQIEMDPSDGSIEKTAFSAPQGQVAYVRMPMGLTSSPSTFMRLVEASLRGLPPGIALAFVDDICCPTQGSMEQHMQDVGMVFDKLLEAGFTVKCEKVHIGKREVPYLGFLVGSYGTRPDPKKLQPLLDMTAEAMGSDGAAASRFAGMIGFYSRFIENCQFLLAPFHDLKQKNATAREIMPSLRFKSHFAVLKQSLLNITAIQRPDYTKPFFVDVDSAVTGCTASVLSQRALPDDPDSHEPLGFHSGRLSDQERAYPVHEVECLGLLRSLRHWRSYLLGSNVIVRTDHKSLQWLLQRQHRAGSRIGEWAVEVSQYSPQIDYVPGKLHMVPDCLSRANTVTACSEKDGMVLTFSLQVLEEEEQVVSVFLGSVQEGEKKEGDTTADIAAAAADATVPPPTSDSISVVAAADATVLPLASDSITASLPSEWNTDLETLEADCKGTIERLIRAVEERLSQAVDMVVGAEADSQPDVTTSDVSFGNDFIHLIAHSIREEAPLLLQLPNTCPIRASFRSLAHENKCNGTTPQLLVSEAELSELMRLQVQALFQIAPGDTEQRIKELLSQLGGDQSRLVCVATDCHRDIGFTRVVSLVLPSSLIQIPPTPSHAFTVMHPQAYPEVSGLLLLPSLAPVTGAHVLVEVIDGALKLPAALVAPQMDRPRTYRMVLQKYICDGVQEQSVGALQAAIQHATKCPARTGRHLVLKGPLYVGVLQVDTEWQLRSNCSPARLEFLPLTAELAYGFKDESDFWAVNAAFQRLAVLADSAPQSPLPYLSSRLEAARAPLQASMCETDITHFETSGVACLLRDGTVPSLTDIGFEDGPAFVGNGDHCKLALGRLRAALQGNVTQSIAVDLEGALSTSPYKRAEIDLVQICVVQESGAVVCFVFDTFETGILQESDSLSMKAFLESVHPKVLHCCYGDAAALLQHGIRLQPVFDTGVADSILIGRHYNSPRDLGTVLLHWLGEQAVHLSHKGKLVFTERMFQERPLPAHLFVYAYEDVLYCNLLYTTLRAALEERGLLELTLALSQQRCTPTYATFTPTLAHLALADATHVVCLEDINTGIHYLPSGSLEGSSREVIRQFARETWLSQMGPPPRGVASAVHARLQRPIKLSSSWLLITHVPNCSIYLEALQASLTDSQLSPTQFRIVLREIDSAHPSVGVDQSAAASFQLLAFEARRITHRSKNAATSAFSSISLDKPSFQDRSGTAFLAAEAYVPTTDSDSHDHAYIVTGPVASEFRVSVILAGFDDTMPSAFFALHSAFSFDQELFTLPQLSFPSCPLEVGCSGHDAASRVIDRWLGNAARRGGVLPLEDDNPFHLCPLFSRALVEALQQLVYVGNSGTLLYYWCNVPNLSAFRSATHATRSKVNGFRLTATQEKKFPGGDVFEECCAELLPPSDVEAWKRLHSYRAGEASFEEPPSAQHSEPSDERVIGEEAVSAWVGSSYNHNHLQQQHFQDLGNKTNWFEKLVNIDSVSFSTSSDFPFEETAPFEIDLPVGNDVEADLLFEAAAVYHLALNCSNCGDTTDSSEFAGVADMLPSNDDADADGLPPRYRSPSRADIRAAQECHPASRQWMVALKADLCDRPFVMEPCIPQEGEPEFRAFCKELDRHVLSEDGLLLRRCRRFKVESNGEMFEHGPLDRTRIVLPPKYQTWAMSMQHDRNGHQGVLKGFPGLVLRYFWGTKRQMRKDFSEYVGDCRTCAYCKLAHHKPGSGVVVQNGEHPFDIVSGDYFKVGRASKKGAQVNVEVTVGAPNLEPTAPDDVLIEGDEKEGVAAFDGTVSFACQFSRMIKVAAVKGQPTSRTIARILINEVIRHYGTPRAVRSDHGSNFVSAMIRALYQHFGIRMEASAPYMHRTIGLVERWHSVLKHLIMTHYHVSKDARWHVYLPFMELSFNAAVNSATGYSPFFVVNLRMPRLPGDSLSSPIKLAKGEKELPDWFYEYLAVRGIVYDAVSQKLKLNSLHRLRAFNLKRDVNVEFKPGDRVLIVKGTAVDKKIPKAEEPTEGPFTIERKLPSGNYTLADLHTRRIKNSFNVERLIRFPTRRTIAQCELSDWYPVECIVGRRVSSKDASILQYRIKWNGFDSSYSVWLDSEYLADIAPLLADYNVKYPLPSTFQPEPLERESRDAVTTPAVEAAARARHHFRHTHGQTSISQPPSVVPEDPSSAPSFLPDCIPELPPPSDITETTPSPESTPLLFDQLATGTRVEVFLADASRQLGRSWKSTGFDVWLPAVVKRTRVLPARNGQMERSTVVVVFENDRSSREYGFELGALSKNPLRSVTTSATAHTSPQPTWVRCAHGAVLVAGDENCLNSAYFSFVRCRHVACGKTCGEWFEKLSSTPQWDVLLGGGRFPSILNK